LERKKIRAKIILAGIIRLFFTVLAVIILSILGYMVFVKTILAVHLHALK